MTSSALQIVQRILITATAVVLALVIGATFLRVVRPPDPDAIARNRIAAGSTAPPGTVADGGLPAVPPGGTALPEDTAPPTTTVTTVPEGASCDEPPVPSGGGTLLRIYYTCRGSAVPTGDSFIYRTVPATQTVLTATLNEMVEGPTEDEQELGYTSLFSEATGDAIAGLSLSSGEATVNFRGLDEIDGLGAGDAGLFLLAEINANVFQFDTVSSVVYQLDGSCAAFWELFQGECQTVTRPDWQNQLREWRGG